jgi:hypothetical protein
MMKTTPSQQTPLGGSDHRLVWLPVGGIIQRGDKFLSDDGRYLEMDNLGRLLGVRCLGQTLKKEGAWFREPNTQDQPR